MSAAQRRHSARRVALASAVVLVLLGALLIAVAREGSTHGGPNYAIDRNPFLPTDYEAPQPAASDPDFRLILVGDAGDAGTSDPVLALIGRWSEAHPERTAVLFLGDNLYPSGLLSESDERGKQVLRRLIDSTRARKIFLPGNHDWGTSFRRPLRPGALELQQEFIESHGEHADFEPEDRCPGPVPIELAGPEPGGFRGLTVLALDLHWWMLDETSRPVCESIRETSDFVAALRSELEARRHENVIVAAHHPIRSGGPHGGYTRGFWRDLLTSVAYRFYTLQDLVEPGYRDIVGVLSEAMAEARPLAMVAGHDHSLQILDGGDASGLIVVSGSATRVSRVTAIEGTLFAHAARGFVVLDFHAGADGSRQVFARVVELGHDEPVADFAVQLEDEDEEGDDVFGESRANAKTFSEFLPLPTEEIAELMRDAQELAVQESDWVAGWTWPVHRLEVRHPATDRVLSLKWKAAPEGLERRNNTPRREIAADRIQRWFLDPEDFVVPPTVGACLPLDVYAAVDPEAVPNVDGANCVFGTLSAWLSGVETPDEILDPVRFERDETYARNLGRYNLLTLLIDNRDTRPANVLVSADSDRRVFSIDNGVSFGEPIFNPFRSHWRVLRVPALPREAIDRLREVGEDELRSLAVVAEFRVDDEGLRASEPSRPFAVQKGVRRRGDVLQLGLEPEEIRGVAERLRNLLAAVDAKEIATF